MLLTILIAYQSVICWTVTANKAIALYIPRTPLAHTCGKAHIHRFITS